MTVAYRAGRTLAGLARADQSARGFPVNADEPGNRAHAKAGAGRDVARRVQQQATTVMGP